MSDRVKSGLIIAVTLLLGFLVGMLATGAVHRARITRLREFQSRGAIASVIRHRVRPSPEQREPVREILQKYEPRLRQMREAHREEMERVLDSLADELGAVLTPAQMRRLRRHGPSHEPGPGPGDRRMRGRRRHDGRERPPGVPDSPLAE
jgi:hypothetical protein